ncbi:MAG: TetR/AcrR family transcriptional regulator [Deltaproteobacteria bacterium]|nr:TetR/AcrR family transcriptional regulator [Deltaproteobacteria bacterium]
MVKKPQKLNPVNRTRERLGNTQEHIIETAAKKKKKNGYARTTTRLLAAAAGVNEVTLFRRFGTKENLFSAVIKKYGGTAVANEIEAQFTGNYHEDMLMVGKEFMKVMFERKNALQLMLFEANHFSNVKKVMAQNPRQLRRMLARYFQMQIDKKVVRPLHPEAMAQAFIGMFFTYIISFGMLEDPIEPEIQTEELITLFVEIFIKGTINQD